MTIVFLLLLSVLPRDDTLRESVDLIELNHFYDDNGKPVFDQIIFYDWCTKDERFHVRDWRLVKSDTQLPAKDHKTSTYYVHFMDGERFRRILSRSYTETWSQWDPELLEREILPKEKRIPLLTPRKPPHVRSH